MTQEDRPFTQPVQVLVKTMYMTLETNHWFAWEKRNGQLVEFMDSVNAHEILVKVSPQYKVRIDFNGAKRRALKEKAETVIKLKL